MFWKKGKSNLSQASGVLSAWTPSRAYCFRLLSYDIAGGREEGRGKNADDIAEKGKGTQRYRITFLKVKLLFAVVLINHEITFF